jgi:hypothetical protein
VEDPWRKLQVPCIRCGRLIIADGMSNHYRTGHAGVSQREASEASERARFGAMRLVTQSEARTRR